jgi:RND family efflux transporter MFP subunit
MSHLLGPTNAAPAQPPATRSDLSPAAPTAPAGDANNVSKFGQIVRFLFAWVPSVLVTAGLVAIGWYGHQHEWKLPNAGFSTTFVDDEAWCDSHGVPEAECIVCQPDLIEAPPVLSFCDQHGVHGCVLCNPSLAETKQPTAPTPSDLERARRALSLRPRLENLPISSSPGARIQFASLAAMNKAGVDVEPVERRGVVESLAAAAEIRYDATKTAQVAPPADGTVRRIMADLGSWVPRGQVLALIDSTAAGRLKTALLAALADERLQQATVARLRPLAGEAVAGKRLLESENDLRQASAVVERSAAELGNLGIHVDLVQLRQLEREDARQYVHRLGLAGVSADLLPEQNQNNLIAVIAPLEGEIVQRSVTLGQVADRGSELFLLVNTRNVWLDLRVPAEQAGLVTIGQLVRFQPDGERQSHTGQVTWISSDVDPNTRTVRVRAELANTQRNLRHESFGRGQIVLRDEVDAIVVPASAIQWDGAGQIVFVRDANFFQQGRPKFFVSRSVRTGVTQDGFVEIIAGVLPGEVVATTGSDVLRSQLLRSNLGAGCTCGQ